MYRYANRRRKGLEGACHHFWMSFAHEGSVPVQWRELGTARCAGSESFPAPPESATYLANISSNRSSYRHRICGQVRACAWRVRLAAAMFANASGADSRHVRAASH